MGRKQVFRIILEILAITALTLHPGEQRWGGGVQGALQVRT